MGSRPITERIRQSGEGAPAGAMAGGDHTQSKLSHRFRGLGYDLLIGAREMEASITA
jgi:hypothetical protein